VQVPPRTQYVRDFLGSAQIFTTAVNDLMEEQLRQVTAAKVTFSQLKLMKMVSLADGYTVGSVAGFLGSATPRQARRSIGWYDADSFTAPRPKTTGAPSGSP